MAGAVRRSRPVRGLQTPQEEEAGELPARCRRARANGEWRDWAGGLPDDVLEKVAGKVVAQTEAGWAVYPKDGSNSEEYIQEQMEERKRDSNCLFVLARVCRGALAR